MGQLSKENKKFSKDNKILRFDTQISEIKELNPNLSLAKCKIAYAGQNRNGSYITQECLDDMATQIAYSAVVGEWKEDKNNFGGHGGKIEITDDGISYIDTTSAYGCVTNEPTWYEDVVEKDGTTHKYLCCNLILFTGKFPELQKVIENGSWQSMEIECVDAEENNGLVYIKKAIFMALCILGKDEENPANNVEPCFESSNIEVIKEQFAFMKNEFKKEFSKMLFEIKKNIENNIDIKKEDNLMKKKEICEKFSLTYEQLEDEIRRNLRTCTYVCEDSYWGECYETRKYYLQDYDENFVYVYDCEQDIYVKLSYSKQGDNVVIDFTSAKRIKFSPVDWEGDSETEDENDISAISEMNMSLKEIFKEKMESIISEKETEFTNAKSEFETKSAEFTSKLEEKNNALLTLNTQHTELTEKFTTLESTLATTISEKDGIIANKNAEIEQFKTDLSKYKLEEKKEKINEVIKEFANVLSKEEIDSFIEKSEAYEKVEDFKTEVKLFVCDKLTANINSGKQVQTNFSSMAIIDNQNENQNNNESKATSVWDRLKDNK